MLVSASIYSKICYQKPHKTVTTSWDRFAEILVSKERELEPDFAKSQMPAWGAYKLEEGSEKRNDEGAVKKISILVLDFDSNGKVTAPDLGDLDHLWGDYVSLLHTTWSDTAGAPATRAVLPLSREVDLEEYKRIWNWASKRSADAGFTVDSQTKDCTRVWILPRTKKVGASTPQWVIHYEEDEEEELKRIPVEDILLLPYDAPVSAGADLEAGELSPDQVIVAKGGKEYTIKEWYNQVEVGDKLKIKCIEHPTSTLGSAWVRKYGTGVAFFCSSAGHGHDTDGNAWKLWWGATDNSTRPADPKVLDKLLWKRDSKGKRTWPPTAGHHNLMVIFEHDKYWSGRFWYDEMHFYEKLDETNITDEMLVEMSGWLEKTYGLKVTKTLVHESSMTVAHQKTRNPLKEYLLGLKRASDDDSILEEWLIKGFGVEDTELNRRFSRYSAIQAVARALDPGCKADSVLVLQGEQGVGKSTAIRALAGAEYFSDEFMDLGSKDGILKMAYCWIYEMGELDHIRTAKMTKVKSFLSRQVDLIRRPYKMCVEEIPRHCVFFATTNELNFLSDSTGDRRFWVARTLQPSKLDWVTANRGEIWAQAVKAYRTGGRWHLTDEEEEARNEATEAFRERDPWEDAITTWVTRESPPGFTVAHAVEMAMQKKVANMRRSDTTRVGMILTKKLKLRKERLGRLGGRRYYYIRPGANPEEAQKAVLIQMGLMDPAWS